MNDPIGMGRLRSFSTGVGGAAQFTVSSVTGDDRELGGVRHKWTFILDCQEASPFSGCNKPLQGCSRMH